MTKTHDDYLAACGIGLIDPGVLKSVYEAGCYISFNFNSSTYDFKFKTSVNKSDYGCGIKISAYELQRESTEYFGIRPMPDKNRIKRVLIKLKTELIKTVSNSSIKLISMYNGALISEINKTLESLND